MTATSHITCRHICIHACKETRTSTHTKVRHTQYNLYAWQFILTALWWFEFGCKRKAARFTTKVYAIFIESHENTWAVLYFTDTAVTVIRHHNWTGNLAPEDSNVFVAWAIIRKKRLTVWFIHIFIQLPFFGELQAVGGLFAVTADVQDTSNCVPVGAHTWISINYEGGKKRRSSCAVYDIAKEHFFCSHTIAQYHIHHTRVQHSSIINRFTQTLSNVQWKVQHVS